MSDQEIKDWIEKLRKKGVSEEQIRNQLIGAGWSIEKLDNIFTSRKSWIKKIYTNRFIRIVINPLPYILLLGVVLYFRYYLYLVNTIEYNIYDKIYSGIPNIRFFIIIVIVITSTLWAYKYWKYIIWFPVSIALLFLFSMIPINNTIVDDYCAERARGFPLTYRYSGYQYNDKIEGCAANSRSNFIFKEVKAQINIDPCFLAVFADCGWDDKYYNIKWFNLIIDLLLYFSTLIFIDYIVRRKKQKLLYLGNLVIFGIFYIIATII